jgi:flagellar hook-associated protein 2
LVDQLSDVERLPQKRLRIEQQGIRDRNTAYDSMVGELGSLQSKLAGLKEASLFQSRTTSVGDSEVALAKAATGAVQGTYNFEFTQLASVARMVGTSGVGQPLSYTPDVSGLVLSGAGLATAVTDGSFSVNGKQVTVSASDTLQDVFDNIASATGGQVTGAYDPVTDRVVLSSAGEIILGSATDSSNFLQVMRLNNNGTGSVSSGGELGGVKLSAALTESNLNTAVTDGGSGAGLFRINGVEISFSEADSMSSVIQRINESAAGVQASYDTLNDRVVLTNRVTGDLGIGLEDVTGNFLSATGLTGGGLERGKDLLYTIDGGETLRSHSNTVTEVSSGLAGLSVTALKEGGSSTVTVATDTETIKTAITGFMDQYNKVQSLIEAKTSIETGSDGSVTAAVLARETEVDEVARQLRGLVFNPISGLSGSLNHLEELGFDTGSDDNGVTLKDADALTLAIENDPSGVLGFFTDADYGLAVKLDEYLERVVGDEGSLVTKQDNLSKQASDIDVQVADLERIVQANRQRLIDSFVAMEQAQAQTNQQLQFLSQKFGGG